jgi:uncharacterized protein (DUF1810 family)
MNLLKSEWIKVTTTKSAYWLYGLGIALALGLAVIIGQFEQPSAGDPIVGERLRRHVRLMLRHDDRTAHGILGSPDDLKFRSCLTLFSAAASNPAHASLFHRGLQTFYGGEPDPATLRLLQTK